MTFVRDLTAAFTDRGTAANEVAAQVWAIAHVAAAKYRWVNLSIVFIFFAVTALAVTAFCAKYYS